MSDRLTIPEIFVIATELVDTNLRNQVNLNKERFVLFYNKAQVDYLKLLIDNTRGNDKIQDAQRFLITASLKRGKSPRKYEIPFLLPSDILKREDILVTCKKGDCISGLFDIEEVKPSEVSYILNHPFRRPDFQARETIYYLGNDSVYLYTDETFDINNVDLIYYRSPKSIDMEGYEKEDGTMSTTIETEWDNAEIYKILDLMVSLYANAKLPVKADNN